MWHVRVRTEIDTGFSRGNLEEKVNYVKRIRKESAETQLETSLRHFSAGAEKEHETRQTGPSVSGPRIKSVFNVRTTSGRIRDSRAIRV
jgi:hypothetical protein